MKFEKFINSFACGVAFATAIFAGLLDAYWCMAFNIVLCLLNGIVVLYTPDNVHRFINWLSE